MIAKSQKYYSKAFFSITLCFASIVVNAQSKIDKVDKIRLFNLSNDKEEKQNLVGQFPETVKELMLLIEKGRKELGDNNRIGEGARFFDDAPKAASIDEYNEWEKNRKK